MTIEGLETTRVAGCSQCLSTHYWNVTESSCRKCGDNSEQAVIGLGTRNFGQGTGCRCKDGYDLASSVIWTDEDKHEKV